MPPAKRRRGLGLRSLAPWILAASIGMVLVMNAKLASSLPRPGVAGEKRPRVPPETPAPTQYRCPVSSSGIPCRIPSAPGSWAAGETCATAVSLADPASPALQDGQPCLDEAAATRLADAAEQSMAAADAWCGVDVGVDRCTCQGAPVACLKSKLARCTDVCRAAAARVRERLAEDRAGAAPSIHRPSAELVGAVFRSFGNRTADPKYPTLSVPPKPKVAFDYKSPAFADVSRHYHGTGIVMWSGGQRLATAFANALFIKQTLLTHLPIQIWTHEGEGDPTAAMLELGRQHDIEFWMLSDDNGGYANFEWQNRWVTGDEYLVRKRVSKTRRREQQAKLLKNADFRQTQYILPDRYLAVALKPFPILLSRFETVIFMDDDIVPLEDPVGFLRLLDEAGYEHSAAFWRDLWGMMPSAPLWEYLPFPGGPGANATYPSQESSISVISKARRGGEGFANLCLSAYMTFHHRTFYPAVYCNTFGADAIGSGDKDMFHVAWLLRGSRYRMMGPPKLVGYEQDQCGHSLAQPDETGRPALLHFNGVKFTYKQFLKGWIKRSMGSYAGQLYFPKPRPTGAALDALNATEKQNLHMYDPNGYDGVDKFRLSGMRWNAHLSPLTMCLSFTYQDQAPMEYQWAVEQPYVDHVRRVFKAGWVTAYMEAVPSPPPTAPPGDMGGPRGMYGFFTGHKFKRPGFRDNQQMIHQKDLLLLPTKAVGTAAADGATHVFRRKHPRKEKRRVLPFLPESSNDGSYEGSGGGSDSADTEAA